MHSYGSWSALGVMTIVDRQAALRSHAGPGHWNDPDMLEVGNGLTPAENRTHFSLWALMAAPLIAGNDIRSMSPETAAVLTNKDIVSIDQDALGIQGFRYSDADSVQAWLRPLQNGDWAAGFVNRSSRPRTISFDWKAHAVTDTLSNRRLETATGVYRTRNLWTGKEGKNTNQPLQAVIPSHDILLLRLTK